MSSLMNTRRRILVLGATGAMGIYLVPELLKMGYSVDAVSRTIQPSFNEHLHYIAGNALDEIFINELLTAKYDAIVDFMIYPTEIFNTRSKLFLSNTKHYIFLSSYRVYGDQQIPITESAPQLYEIVQDDVFLSSDDYALKKSRGESILKTSGNDNWTIIRPAITYSKHRFQLVTMEGRNFVSRAFSGKPVLIPEEALKKEATMTWAGDVAKMISRHILNQKAYGEAFTVSTSEHHTWETIAEYYADLINLKVVPVDMETFLQVIQPDPTNLSSRWQLIYDRLYDRIVDNTKILEVTGLVQSDFMPLYNGLKQELSALKKDDLTLITGSAIQSELMDNYFFKSKKT